MSDRVAFEPSLDALSLWSDVVSSTKILSLVHTQVVSEQIRVMTGNILLKLAVVLHRTREPRTQERALPPPVGPL